jgi:chromosome segregation ATPase
VYWRGRRWRIAGGSEDGGSDPSTADPATDPGGALAAARARIAELEAAVGASGEALGAANARLSALEEAGTTMTTELEQARQQADEAGQRTLEAHRRALLAEHRGEVIEELVQGATPEELDRSVEAAKSAFARIADSVRRGLAEQAVPNGAAPRQADGGEGLSALQKIAQGLRK